LSNFFLRRNLEVAFWIFGPVATVIGTGICIAFSEFFSHCCHSRIRFTLFNKSLQPLCNWLSMILRLRNLLSEL
jgi:hypothetical protein